MINKNSTQVRLTQTVQKGGCAAKVAASELRKILAQVKFPPKLNEILIDGAEFDDAAIIKINSEVAIVQTLDFFTPIVDSPYLFGRIAAANALSDVYAMGGTPQSALAILGFPLATMDSIVASEVLQGACDTLTNATCSLVGGHSIDDDTLKFGLSVNGLVHPQKIWSNQGAKPGDQLILTKKLGTGTLMAGLKREAWSEDDLKETMESMCQINQVLDLIPNSLATSIHAATDITGFGLAGHASHIAKGSRVSLNLHFDQLPVFEKAWASLQEGFLTKAHRTNKDYTQATTRIELSAKQNPLILFDPQTSGGLLLSVAAESSKEVLNHLRSRFAAAQIIGEVQPLADYDWTIS